MILLTLFYLISCILSLSVNYSKNYKSETSDFELQFLHVSVHLLIFLLNPNQVSLIFALLFVENILILFLYIVTLRLYVLLLLDLRDNVTLHLVLHWLLHRRVLGQDGRIVTHLRLRVSLLSLNVHSLRVYLSLVIHFQNNQIIIKYKSIKNSTLFQLLLFFHLLFRRKRLENKVFKLIKVNLLK